MADQILKQIALAEEHNDRQFVTALARGLSILSSFGNSDTALTHQAICDLTSLPKATVSRLIYTLLKSQYLVADPAGGYRLGMASIQLSASAWAQYNITRLAQPLMSRFASENQVSVSLAKEEMGEMLYLASVRSPARLAVQLMVGSKVPIARTAIGRAYFAVADEQQTQLLAFNMQAQNPQTFTADWQRLQDHKIYFEQHGYALSNGEFSSDILAVAVGVYNRAEERFTHSINASAPSTRWHMDDFIRDVAPKLQVLAHQISTQS
ncbi:IclR family transcriptional regulator [Snodgrassella sp. CFCC 13594]|uniref:IclR family transcriptional regulator n=1 Tax=Snodgrassella sp. CFCC 13594 TaxID=1775559 RepID=UPI00082EC6CA|nr:IclR family transcriptional regulator [Snodgrassella sp. CFCC 13594]